VTGTGIQSGETKRMMKNQIDGRQKELILMGGDAVNR
jgi:hypothetical protein